MKYLKNKNILLGVSGSVAIYKSLELIRLYIKSGAKVRVIMTNSATKLISKLLFEAISQNTVLDEETQNWSKSSVNNHIQLGKWADIFIIAPATANTISKLSHGNADNLLLQTALAYQKEKLICPAANTNMIENPITQSNLKMLKLCNYQIINTIAKELVCRDIGNGAMAEINDIFHATCRVLLKDNYWINRQVILTGGSTIENIDDVRYISNFSSGKMANALATALYYQGANVCFITSKIMSSLPPQITTINVQNTKEMLNNLNEHIKFVNKNMSNLSTPKKQSNTKRTNKKPFFFCVAAIGDYVVKTPQTGKIKKQDKGKSWNLELTENIDILSSVNKTDIISIGFKAEFNKTDSKNNALNMLKTKNIDAVCLNVIGDDNNFGSDKNTIEFITKNGDSRLWETTEKLELSFLILQQLKKDFTCE